MGDGDQSYVIDVCAIGDLTGENRPNQLYHNPYEAERVWAGLDALIEQRRLATVYQAKREMQEHCPNGYARLGHYGRKFFVPRLASVWTAAMRVLAAAEERTRLRAAMAKPTRDPADVYLVALADVRNAKIVTSELGRYERVANTKNDERIPDLCLAYFGSKDRVLHLEDLVRLEGWLRLTRFLNQTP